MIDIHGFFNSMNQKLEKTLHTLFTNTELAKVHFLIVLDLACFTWKDVNISKYSSNLDFGMM